MDAARAYAVWEAVDAVTAALGDAAAVMRALPSAELGSFMISVDRMVAVGATSRVEATAEAESRGDIAAAQAGSTGAWVRDHCVSLTHGEAHTVARCAALLGRRDLHGLPDAIRQADLTPVLLSKWPSASTPSLICCCRRRTRW